MEQDEELPSPPHTQLQTSSTVLPKPFANIVSLVTRSSALYLRLGTYIGSLALDSARVTTLTGLELSRAIIEGILSRAGDDVAKRSIGELGRAEAESLLERSITTLHSTITHISFAASTGFHISSTSLSAASDLSQHLLATLDSILGSTDSSRAIASIVTLIRREFQNPATGQPGERIGVVDLLVGICGLALLQRWCQRLTEQEFHDRHRDDVVWDLVVFDNGSRADVVGPQDCALKRAGDDNKQHSSVAAIDEKRIVQTIQNRDLLEDQDEWPEEDLKQKIMQSLPPDANVSITTETTTTKTITVEITGAQPPDLLPLEGVEIVEENMHDPGNVLTGSNLTGQTQSHSASKYRVVYRTVRNSILGTNIAAVDGPPQIVEHIPSQLKTAIDDSIEIREISSSDNISITQSPEEKSRSPSTRDDAGPESPSKHAANSKRSRKAASTTSLVSLSNSDKSLPRITSEDKIPARKSKGETLKKNTEIKGSIRNALRKGSGLFNKDAQLPDIPSTSSKENIKPPWNGGKAVANKSRNLLIPPRDSSLVPARNFPRAPKHGNPNYFTSDDLGPSGTELTRSSSRTSFYEVHEKRRDSMVSQTDTYSLYSADTRPSSPTAFRKNLKIESTQPHRKSHDKTLSVPPSPPAKTHRPTKSYDPSIYTLKTNTSETSLVLASQNDFGNGSRLQSLSRDGVIPGLFPSRHFVWNISRFIRFASASYGSHFMRIMGISSPPTTSSPIPDPTLHTEHHSFGTHTNLPPSTILLSSFVDPQGGTDSSGNTGTNVPLVHFISLDHESKAVVLSCRGTLGFEDVLTDMSCEYDDLVIREKSYKVHKGIHASAVRLLSASSRVLATLATALEDNPDYGLVLAGHSLGGAVVALLAIMLSTPGSPSFVTSHPPPLRITASSSTSSSGVSQRTLPPGRPIHVYAYGPPATISPSLRKATSGLITTIVNNADLVPFLSLGTLHDLQSVALAFKTDSSGAAAKVRARVWSGLRGGLRASWYRGEHEASLRDSIPISSQSQSGTGSHNSDGMAGIPEEDQWAWATLKTLRAGMLSEKLVPPGEVFLLETTRVLQRDAFTRHEGGDGKDRGLGKPATRAILKWMRDPEAIFSEVKFKGGMLGDHSPGRYEASLRDLRKGVLG
jgi:hypothetical protein